LGVKSKLQLISPFDTVNWLGTKQIRGTWWIPFSSEQTDSTLFALCSFSLGIVVILRGIWETRKRGESKQ